MQYHSTKSPRQAVGLREAVLAGLPPDNGLYVPTKIPPMPLGFLDEFRALPFDELAFRVTQPLVDNEVPRDILRNIITETLSFDAPIHPLEDGVAILELFHGPTLAFKDFGARFMARLMSWLVRDAKRKLTILVATSGDTGGAVANGFLGAAGIEVVILYPKGKVSPRQELQLVTPGQNVRALAVDGSFDDCQALVKRAFLDESLRDTHWLSSANSINIARLIPQAWYYWRAVQQLSPELRPTFCVPSGNFGNLTAGLIAQRMGLPTRGFIAATNANDVVPAYLQTGTYAPRPSVRTISNAMDVGAPSNFARMQHLLPDFENFSSQIKGYAFDDTRTEQAIVATHEKLGYLADPHTAVGILAAQAQLEKDRKSGPVVVLSTAHPAKFPEVMEPLVGEIPLPDQLAGLEALPRHVDDLPNSYAALRDWLSSS